MGIEAELKARVRNPDRVWELLRQRATPQNSVYYNVYFDTPDRTLTRSGRELRVREAHTDALRAVLAVVVGLIECGQLGLDVVGFGDTEIAVAGESNPAAVADRAWPCR